MPNFQYQARPAEAWKQREEQTGSNYISFIQDGIQVFQASKSNWIRPLPPTWANAKHYGMDIWVHYSVGPQNAQVLCILKMKNETCPLCEAYSKADADGKEDAYDYKSTRRVLFYLVDRQEEDKDKAKKPFAWASPWTLDRDITKICRDKQTGEIYFIDHPESGYDVSFDREGELPNVKYVGIQIARRPSPVESYYLEAIMEKPLPSILIWRNYEEIRALFEGQSAVSDSAPTPQQQQQIQQPLPRQELFARPETQPVQQPLQQQFQPVVQQPIQQQVVQPAFCNKAVSFQGRRIGCKFALGHDGDCDFQIDYGIIETQQPVVQQPQPMQPAAVTSGTQRNTAASLRERFNK